jgi:hypothetical protein
LLRNREDRLTIKEAQRHLWLNSLNNFDIKSINICGKDDSFSGLKFNRHQSFSIKIHQSFHD